MYHLDGATCWCNYFKICWLMKKLRPKNIPNSWNLTSKISGENGAFEDFTESLQIEFLILFFYSIEKSITNRYIEKKVGVTALTFAWIAIALTLPPKTYWLSKRRVYCVIVVMCYCWKLIWKIKSIFTFVKELSFQRYKLWQLYYINKSLICELFVDNPKHLTTLCERQFYGKDYIVMDYKIASTVMINVL